MRQTFRLLLKVCLCYSVALWAVIQLCPGAFARIFTPNVALVAFTVPALRIYCGAVSYTHLCLPLILIVSAFAALVASGGAPRASIYMGKQDHDTAEKILGGCFALQLAVSALLTAVLLLWSRDLLLAFGASENTIGYAASYMQIYAVGTVFVQLTLGLNAFITAQGFAKIGMRTVLIGAVANIVLEMCIRDRLPPEHPHRVPRHRHGGQRDGAGRGAAAHCAAPE